MCPHTRMYTSILMSTHTTHTDKRQSERGEEMEGEERGEEERTGEGTGEERSKRREEREEEGLKLDKKSDSCLLHPSFSNN